MAQLFHISPNQISVPRLDLFVYSGLSFLTLFLRYLEASHLYKKPSKERSVSPQIFGLKVWLLQRRSLLC